ncbi:hypothetical protein Tco_0254426, partial [Tanacetum coccineum]
VKSASTPTDLERPLVKDADADDVDEHLKLNMWLLQVAVDKFSGSKTNCLIM